MRRCASDSIDPLSEHIFKCQDVVPFEFRHQIIANFEPLSLRTLCRWQGAERAAAKIQFQFPRLRHLISDHEICERQMFVRVQYMRQNCISSAVQAGQTYRGVAELRGQTRGLVR